MEEIAEKYRKAVAESPIDEQLQEMERVATRYLTDFPAPILKNIKTPFISENTVEKLFYMHWHVVPAGSTTYFVTSDTPAHYFSDRGIGNDNSEFTFTFSKTLAVVCEARKQTGLSFHTKASSQTNKEINRRIISTTERFVFSPRADSWIGTLAQNPKLRLNEIRWEY